MKYINRNIIILRESYTKIRAQIIVAKGFVIRTTTSNLARPCLTLSLHIFQDCYSEWLGGMLIHFFLIRIVRNNESPATKRREIAR